MFYPIMIDADKTITAVAHKAIGWSGNLSAPLVRPTIPEDGVYVDPGLVAPPGVPWDTVGSDGSRSCVEQIDMLRMVTPDITNSDMVSALYNPIAGMALTLFSTLLLIGVIAYLWGQITDEYASHSELISIVKRSFVEMPAIYFGLDIFVCLLYGNELLSSMFAGTVSVDSLVVAGLMDPSGLIVLSYAIGVVLTSWFYLCRFYILLIAIMIWPIGCLLRIFELTRPTGLLILRIAVINIFLGSWMCLCYAAGGWMIDVGPDGMFVGWGSNFAGVVIMFFALWVPLLLWRSQIGHGFERTGRKAVMYVKMAV